MILSLISEHLLRITFNAKECTLFLGFLLAEESSELDSFSETSYLTLSFFEGARSLFNGVSQRIDSITQLQSSSANS